MVNCSKCGSKLDTNERFCANCGTLVETAPSIVSPDTGPTSFEGNLGDMPPGFPGFDYEPQESAAGYKQNLQNIFSKIRADPKLLLTTLIVICGMGAAVYFFVLPHGGSSCGNDVCDVGEDFNSCPYDCQQLNNTGCGNGNCTGNETFQNCPADCKKALGQNCTQDEECTAGYCVHKKCRTTSIYCGDTYCDENETSVICPFDCGECGNEVCDPGETEAQCPQDCGGLCGNHVCDATHGENGTTCPIDCAVCGNGVCELTENRDSCPADCRLCGNNKCDPGENLYNCAQDCARCGDKICTVGIEDFQKCPKDCTCGNDVCEPELGENSRNCLQDCHCGDGICQSYESPETCPEDCIFCGEEMVDKPEDCAKQTGCGTLGCKKKEEIFQHGESVGFSCECANYGCLGFQYGNEPELCSQWLCPEGQTCITEVGLESHCYCGNP